MFLSSKACCKLLRKPVTTSSSTSSPRALVDFAGLVWADAVEAARTSATSEAPASRRRSVVVVRWRFHLYPSLAIRPSIWCR